MKRGYSDRLAEMELRLMNQKRGIGSGSDIVSYARERRKLFVKVKNPQKLWTRRYW